MSDGVRKISLEIPEETRSRELDVRKDDEDKLKAIETFLRKSKRTVSKVHMIEDEMGENVDVIVEKMRNVKAILTSLHAVCYSMRPLLGNSESKHRLLFFYFFQYSNSPLIRKKCSSDAGLAAAKEMFGRTVQRKLDRRIVTKDAVAYSLRGKNVERPSETLLLNEDNVITE